MSEEALSHYGKKGMKWGVRQNKNYSNDQATRDSRIYGNRGSKRINKAMNKGESVSTARAAEKTRRDRVMNRNPIARNVGKIAGGAVGAIALNVAANNLGRLPGTKLGAKFLKSETSRSIMSATIQSLNTPTFRAALTLGAGSIGAKVAGDLGVAVNMRTAGYNPTRKK